MAASRQSARRCVCAASPPLCAFAQYCLDNAGPFTRMLPPEERTDYAEPSREPDDVHPRTPTGTTRMTSTVLGQGSKPATGPTIPFLCFFCFVRALLFLAVFPSRYRPPNTVFQMSENNGAATFVRARPHSKPLANTNTCWLRFSRRLRFGR